MNQRTRTFSLFDALHPRVAGGTGLTRPCIACTARHCFRPAPVRSRLGCRKLCGVCTDRFIHAGIQRELLMMPIGRPARPGPDRPGGHPPAAG